MDRFKSAFTWVFLIGSVAIMFPVTCLLWFVGYPFESEGRLVHRWLMFQGRYITRILPLWKFTIEGLEKIQKDQAYVIISNHQSILDIVLLTNLDCNFRWISKTENFRVPLLGLSMKMARYIEVERGNKESVIRMMERSVETLQKNISIMMFPEGTRSKSTATLPFKTGAFQLALKTDKPVLPVIVEGTGKVLPKHGYRFSSGHRLRVRVLDPVFPGSFGTGDHEELAVVFRSMMVDELTKMRQES